MQNSERQMEVAALVECAKTALAGTALSRDTLAAVLGRLEAMAALRRLWQGTDYAAPEEGERQARYLIREDPDRPRDGIRLERLQRHPSGNAVQEFDFVENIANRDERVAGHHSTRMASRSMSPFINGCSAFLVVIVTGIPSRSLISSSSCISRKILGIFASAS